MNMITLEALGSVGVVTLSNPPHNLIGRDFIEEFCCAQERAVALLGLLYLVAPGL